MIGINDLAGRLIRMGPPAYGYHVGRAAVASVDDGLRWMREWHDGAGAYTWMGASDAQRRRAVKHWLFLRHAHRAEWRKRGGVEA